MKTGKMIAVSSSAIATTALMIAGRGLLPEIFVGVLSLSIASTTGFLAYQGHRFFTKGRMLQLEMEAKQLENRLIEQNILDQEIQRQIALGTFALERHIQQTRIYADQHGIMPVLVSNEQDYLPSRLDVLQLPQYARQAAPTSAQLALPEVSGNRQQDETSVPVAPLFRSMSHLLQGEKLPLCWTANGPLYGTVLDLLSMAVTGKPGRGKTTALMYYVAILLSCGAEVTIWDPHGVMGELAALNGRELPNMPETAKVYYYDRKEDIIASLPALEVDLVERDELYRPPNRQIKHPHLLLADELPLLAEYDEELKARAKRTARAGGNEDETALTLIRTIKRFVLEARKWNCYFIGSGQSMDAEILPTRVTENLASRIVFFSSDRRARMAGLENDAIKKYLPIIRRAGSGVMVFDCARFDEPILGAIPMITINDLMAFLGLAANDYDEMEMLQPNPLNVLRSSGTPHYTRFEQDFSQRPDAQNNTFSGDSGEEYNQRSNVRPSLKLLPNQPVESLDATPEERPEYRLADQEINAFVAAYKASGSIDKALSAINRGTRYRAHGSEIVSAYNLRKKA